MTWMPELFASGDNCDAMANKLKIYHNTRVKFLQHVTLTEMLNKLIMCTLYLLFNHHNLDNIQADTHKITIYPQFKKILI